MLGEKTQKAVGIPRQQACQQTEVPEATTKIQPKRSGQSRRDCRKLGEDVPKEDMGWQGVWRCKEENHHDLARMRISSREQLDGKERKKTLKSQIFFFCLPN